MAKPTVDMGWEYIEDQATVLANASGAVQVFPPTGKKIVSGGYHLGGATGVYINYARVSQYGDAYTVNIDTGSNNCLLTVSAVAIYAD